MIEKYIFQGPLEPWKLHRVPNGIVEWAPPGFAFQPNSVIKSPSKLETSKARLLFEGDSKVSYTFSQFKIDIQEMAHEAHWNDENMPLLPDNNLTTRAIYSPDVSPWKESRMKLQSGFVHNIPFSVNQFELINRLQCLEVPIGSLTRFSNYL